MTDKLPPNLLKLFLPRPALQHTVPLDRDPEQRRRPEISGLAAFLDRCKDHDKDYVPTETVAEIKARKAAEKKAKQEQRLTDAIAGWRPSEDDQATNDPYKTLFVGRLNYSTTEKGLRKHFEQWGPIKSCRLVTDQNGKSRGYAFIEYEKEKDMKGAYKEADTSKLDDRRILVDVERGRTVKDWRPRRLGGGLGGATRKPGFDQNQRVFSGREGGPMMGGNNYDHYDDRGGFRGGPPRFGGGFNDRGYGGGGGYGHQGGYRGPPGGGGGYGHGGFDRRGPGGPPPDRNFGGDRGYLDRPHFGGDRGDRAAFGGDRGYANGNGFDKPPRDEVRIKQEGETGDKYGSRDHRSSRSDRDRDRGDDRHERSDRDRERSGRRDRDRDRSRSPRRDRRERSRERGRGDRDR
ncbi:hypothetical protein HK097_010720 [Rhizophlyctis rosea]|uniref:RRM domain-containing protein n=1 Tax=Rhizophlyctis rosea TaxID=64517 RepID=A0AAD5X8R8_9FUNG|nr:hypothetical protein HK097_010720 [Rhizophlyctis rosea]